MGDATAKGDSAFIPVTYSSFLPCDIVPYVPILCRWHGRLWCAGSSRVDRHTPILWTSIHQIHIKCMCAKWRHRSRKWYWTLEIKSRTRNRGVTRGLIWRLRWRSDDQKFRDHGIVAHLNRAIVGVHSSSPNQTVCDFCMIFPMKRCSLSL